MVYYGWICLVVLAVPILKHDGVRQWEGWHPIYEMEHKSKPPTRQLLFLRYPNIQRPHLKHLRKKKNRSSGMVLDRMERLSSQANTEIENSKFYLQKNTSGVVLIPFCEGMDHNFQVITTELGNMTHWDYNWYRNNMTQRCITDLVSNHPAIIVVSIQFLLQIIHHTALHGGKCCTTYPGMSISLIIMIFSVKINALSCPRPVGKAISPFSPEIGLVIIMVSLNFIIFLCLQRGHLWPTYWKGWPTPELVPLDLFRWWIPKVSGITLITPHWINPRRKQDVIPFKWLENGFGWDQHGSKLIQLATNHW